MARNWTESQLDAIRAVNGSILVSAAAGSGKTAVLVQRVIERLTDKENPCSADRLLIVTFTRAAAGEMRMRISGAIESLLRLHPGDKNLINQQMLLSAAKICTIDSFCNRLVRDNFQLLDISPDFKNADEGELKLLKSQAMELTLEQMYEKQDKNFLSLVELLFRGRDDSYLADMIYELYSASISYPFPERWLDEVCEKYESNQSVTDSVYGKIILDYIKQAVEYCLDLLSEMRSIISGCEEYEKAFKKAVDSDYLQIKNIYDKVQKRSWDEAKAAIASFSAERRGRLSAEMKSESEVQMIIDSRDKIKKVIKETIAGIMCCNEDEFQRDMDYLAPMIKSLCSAVKLFAENFTLLKREKSLADFDDITHMALSLLVRPGEGESIEITDFAKSLSLDFDEILIDEYQDTNKAQDMLFASISRNNLFRVGDVKQSIYRFRRAMPEIFIGLKDSYKLYDRSKDEYPAKIVLGNNFRSRKSVTSSVNFVFSQLMSKSVGDIDYTDEEKLVFSAAYSEKSDECAELHILETDELNKNEESSDEFQARYIAEMIDSMIKSGFTVQDGEGQRKARFGDFCILLRSVNGSRGAVYAEQLRKRNIPCFTEVAANFFSSYEISLVLNILRIIDNPRQDIPLLSVMMSVLFGFSVDEVAKMRINDRAGDLYSCLLNSAAENEKSKSFLEKIRGLRSLSVSMGTEDFIRYIYDEFSLPVIALAMNASSAKTANLMLLLDYASVYEKSGYIGLSGFIGFIDRLERERQDLAGSIGIAGETDTVKIMSIHKSKGLEFPVCIIGNCAGKFNRSDEINNMVISSKNGVGLVLRHTDTFAQYPSACYNAVKLSIKADSISEEMRVLYVAMTRAREKLIMVCAAKNLEKTLRKCSVNINSSGKKVAPFAASLAGSYSEWLLTAFLRHRDAGALRNLAGLGDDAVLKSDFKLKVKVSSWNPQEQEEQTEEEQSEIDSDFLSLIEERCAYKYKYEPLTYAVSKRAASEVDKNSVDREYFASSRPAFLSSDGLTAAQRGTATHKFMQFADYEKAAVSVKDEISRICEKGFISKKEVNAINVSAIERFFKSELSKRILSSSLVMREKKFTVSVPINEVYPELKEFSDEQVLLQGIADCAFVENGRLVVVDYKTDNLKTEDEFRKKYSAQVKVYKTALEMCTDYEVSQTYLYSFRLNREIEVL